MDQQAKQQIADRLKTANNVLVTVSTNPSVDQLSALIGFTLLLNKMGKHGTAVFSGEVPSTIEFLKPEETLEKTTDSLRDFIIALDKAKADKLRYKVEDKVVKIFITPYRTSIDEKDLDFSQGDFNVDMVVALGVKEQKDIDAAITAHGRILHDATVVSINTTEKGNIGTINWNEPDYSSLCELLFSLGEEFDANLLDAQMATAFLTGIVAETDRFSNDKTSPHTMTVAARLMGLGANQQLIATKLEKEATPEPFRSKKDKSKSPAKKEYKSEPEEPENKREAKPEEPAESEKKDDGSLKIEHDVPPPAPLEDRPFNDQIHIDETGNLNPTRDTSQLKEKENKTDEHNRPKPAENSRMALEPPTLGGKLTANSEPEVYDPSTDPLTLPSTVPPILSRNTSDSSVEEALSGNEDEVPADSEPVPNPDAARNAVDEALRSSTPQKLDPIEALGAQPIDLGKADPVPALPNPVNTPTPSPLANSPLTPFPIPEPQAPPQPFLPPNLAIPQAPTSPVTNSGGPATPPPPVPPPMMPPGFTMPPPSDDPIPPINPQ